MFIGIETIIGQIKNMNTLFERPEGMGVDRDHEYVFFLEELEELYREGCKPQDLIGSLDALIDIVVFGIGVLHKQGDDIQTISDRIASGGYIDIRSIDSSTLYRLRIQDILYTVLTTLVSLIGPRLCIELFDEVYQSNMSKLKDGKPIRGNLPGKFGKNPETYFKPNLSKRLLGDT
ncbi:MAG TPA: hypothetical protein PLW93_03275 [Candidatus Absconditabacterales bacterium]|nr:hypothetical protein [Candidatus Absconditabacterales bacterium]HNG97270.1 hypothetical protein [Candidatus Absconditabacterales bacterium]